MKYSQRYVELNSQFQLGVDMHLKESNIDIRFIKFDSGMQPVISNHDDSHLDENLSFVYPVFMPKEIQKADKAILLLHGLNERNWNKYLTWAEFLCKETGKPVILFPIAFHINRTPQSWFNPRDLQGLLDLRRQRNGVDRMLSFANVS
ncbi:MAG: DUF6051 family protein, partial [Paludibacter sp.]